LLDLSGRCTTQREDDQHHHQIHTSKGSTCGRHRIEA
jgi:hypothetical protein